MAQKRIKFGIDFETNLSGLKSLQAELTKISQLKIQGLTDKNEIDKIKDARTAAKELQDILNKSFNVKLNTVDVSRFSQELKKSGNTLHDYQLKLNRLGEDGKTAFRHLATEIATANTELKRTDSFLDNIGSTLVNAAKWSVAYGAIHKIAESIRESYNFTKDLDESLNDIRIVTNKSAEDMAQFAKQANTAAAALGKTTKDYTTASLLYYQQGLSDKEVAARTNVTLKAANVTGQSTQEVSQQLTAVWNGYKVSAEEAELYIDKVAAVAATTASNLQELSEGMSKVASAANTMGVDIDQLNAQLSTIISVTRQDAATAGTALKTIYARMTDIESGLDTETTLGEYTSKMAQFGIQVLDSKGALRDVGDVMDEIGGKWDTFTKTQQVALAQAMAGTRQYNNLMALFGNWDMYTKSLRTSQQAAGTLQNQQDIYMDSMEAHLNQLTAAKEKLYDSFFDEESFKKIIDGITFVVERISSFVDTLGGMGPTLSFIGSILLQVFGKQISNGIADMVINMKNFSTNTKDSVEKIKQLKDLDFSAEKGLNEMTKTIVEAGIEAEKLYKAGLITPEEKQDFDSRIKQINEIADAYDNLRRERKISEEELQESGIKTDFNDAEKSINSIELQKEIQEAIIKSNGDLNDFISSLDKATQSLDKDNPFKALLESLKELKQETEGLENDLTNLEKSAFKTSTITIGKGKKKKTKKVLDSSEFNAGVNNIDDKMLKTKNTALQKQWSETKKQLDAIDASSKNAYDKMQQKVEAVKQFEQVVAEENKKAARGIKNLGEAGAQAGKKTRQAAKDVANGFKDSNVAIRQATKTATSYIQMATAMVAIGNAVKNMIQTLSNEEATAGEKAEAIISTVLTLLPTLLPIIITISKTVQVEGVKMGTAMWASLGPYAIIGAIIAGVYLFIKAISSIVESYKKEEKAVEKANEALQKQTEIYNEIQSAYEKLKSTIEDYKGMQKAIDEMIAGTQEWKDAVQEANEQVLELINLYPELSRYVQTETKFGITKLTLGEAGLDAAAAAQQEQRNIAFAQKLQAQNNVRDAKNTLAAKDLNKEFNIGQGGGDYWKALSKDLFLTAYGSVIKQGFNIGDAIVDITKGEDIWKSLGKAIPVLSSFIRASEMQIETRQAATEQTEKALQIIADDFLSRGEVAIVEAATILKNEGINDSLIAALTENAATLQENVIALANNTQANKINNQQIMDAYLGSSNEAYKRETNNAIKAAATAVSGAQYGKALEEAEARWADSGSITDKKAQQAYAKLMGWEWVKDKGNNQGEYRKQKEDGSWETFTLSDETARNALAAEDAKKAAADKTYLGFLWQSYNKIASQTKGGERTADALMALAGGQKRTDLLGLTHAEIKALTGQIHTFGFELSDAIALGFKSIKELEDAIMTSADEAAKAWNEASKNIKDSSIKNTFDTLVDNAGISLQAKQKLGNYVSQLGERGEDFNTFIESISEGNRKKVLEAMADISWEENFFATDELAKTLSIVGLTEEELANALTYGQQFFDIISDPANWNTKDIENYFDNLKKVNKTIKEFGDTLDKEQYEKLGNQTRALFTQTGENEFTLGVSYEVFAEAMEADRKKAIENLESAFDEEKDVAKREAKKQRLENKYDYDQAFFTRENYENQLLYNKKTLDTKLESTTKIGTLKEGQVLTEEERNNLIQIKKYADAYGIDIQINKALLNGAILYNDDISKIQNLIAAVKNRILQDQQKIDEQIADYNAYQALDNEKALTQETFNIAIEELKQARTQDDIDRINSYLEGKELSSDQQATLEETLTFAKKQVTLIAKQQEINKIDIKRQSTLDGINAALEKQSNLLSKLEKQASVLAMSEKDRERNLKAQYEAAAAAANEQERLIGYYSTTAVTALEQKARVQDSEMGLKILQMAGDYMDKMDAILAYAAENFANDTDEYLNAVNTLKALIDEQRDIEQELDKAEIDLLDKYAEEAKAYVAALENISKEWTQLLDARRGVNEFLQKTAESSNNYADVAFAYADNYDIATEKYLKYSEIVADELNEINKLKEKGFLTDEDSAKLNELQSAVVQNQQTAQNAVLEMQENIKKIEESRLTLGQKINEQYETQIKNAETQVAVLNHQIKLIKLINGEKAYQNTKDYYTGILEQRQNQTSLNYAKYQEAISTYNALVAAGAEDEIIQKALNDIAETGKAALTSIESTLDAAKQTFEQNVMAVLDEVTNFAAVERDIDNYNWRYNFDQEYMSGMDRSLNVANLRIKYQKAIDNYSGNEAAQKRMIATYQEVNKLLQEKELLTKNDIALAEKRLALEQAKIDLENSQSDTSKMRLVRGANGEYSYQYVADQAAIYDKEEAYNKALLAFRAQEKSNLKAITGQITKLLELETKLSQVETDEERAEMWQRIIALTDALGESIKGVPIQDLPENLQLFIQRWTNQGATSFEELIEKSNQISHDYNEIKKDMQEATVTITDPETGIQVYISETQELSNKLALSLKNLKDDFDDPETGLLAKVGEFRADMLNAIDAIQSASLKLISALAEDANEDGDNGSGSGSGLGGGNGNGIGMYYSTSYFNPDNQFETINKIIDTYYGDFRLYGSERELVQGIIGERYDKAEANQPGMTTVYLEIPNATEIAEALEAWRSIPDDQKVYG